MDVLSRELRASAHKPIGHPLPLVFLTQKEEAEVVGHPGSLSPLSALVPPDGQASSSLLLAHPAPSPPPLQSPFLLLAVCRPFLLGHKGLCRQILCAVCQHGGPGTRRGRGRSQLLSPFTQTFAFSLSVSPPPAPCSLSLNMHTKIKKQLLIRARE